MSPAPTPEVARHQVALVDQAQQAMHALQLDGRTKPSPWSGLPLAVVLIGFGFIARDDYENTPLLIAYFAVLAVFVAVPREWRRARHERVGRGERRLPRNGRTDALTSWGFIAFTPIVAVGGTRAWWLCFPVAAAAAAYVPWIETRWRQAFNRPPAPVSVDGPAAASEALADDDTLRVVATLSLVEGASRPVVARATGLPPEALAAAITAGEQARFVLVRPGRGDQPDRLRISSVGRAHLLSHLRRLDQVIDGRLPAGEAAPVG